MAKRTTSARRESLSYRQFSDLLSQLEHLLQEADVDWSEEAAAEASRRIRRLERAIRLSAETRERF
jgi:hypothetical protein